MYTLLRTLLVCLLMSLVCSAFPADAAQPGSARETAEKGAAVILGLLNDPAFKDPATRDAIRKQVEDEDLKLFDFEEFYTRTVGPQWRQFGPDQKKRFQTAFTDLLRNTYIDTLDSYSGEEIVFTGERSANNGKRVEIQIQFLAQDKAYPAAFRMLNKDGRWVVYDVVIEGISMIKNYRDQFRDILGKVSPDELIARVEAKAVEQLEKKKKAEEKP